MNSHARANADHRESSDGFRGEIYRQGVWRVIVCKDNLQWVLQRFTRADSPSGGRWEGQSYFRTREAALRLWRARTGDDGDLLELILPERFFCRK